VRGQEVGHNLLGLIRALTNVQAAQVRRRRVHRQNAFDEGVGTSGLHLDMVRPAQLHHHDGLVRVGGFPLCGHLRTHRERNTSFVAAGGRNTTITQRAEERGQDDALIKFLEHCRFHGIVIPDMQGRSIHPLSHDLVNVLGHDC